MQIHNSTSLKAAINQLEQKQLIQKEALIDQFHETYESFKPLNIVKSEFKKLTSSFTENLESPGGKTNLINTAIGLGVGFITKKIFVGGSNNIFKKLFGTAVEIGVTKLVAKNADKIRDKGMEVIHNHSSDSLVL